MEPPSNGSPLTAPTKVRGRGEPLLLLPGGLTGLSGLEPLAVRLAQRRRVIQTQHLHVDLGLRGEPLPADYSLRTESHAVLRALDDLEIDTADVVGWSFGGAIGLDVALGHPDRVRSLTLVEPDGDWLLRHFGRFGPDARAFDEIMATCGPDDVSEADLERFLRGVGILPPGTDPKTSPRWPVWLEHRQSLRIGNLPSRHRDDVARLRRFTRPVLLFKGEGSPTFMRETVDLLAQELPNARLEELPGGHELLLASMERFLAILDDFLVASAEA